MEAVRRLNVVGRQDLALKAFAACGGGNGDYGRVDVRERALGSPDVLVLECNPMCSLT